MPGFCSDQNIGFSALYDSVKDGCLYDIDCRLESHTEIDLISLVVFATRSMIAHLTGKLKYNLYTATRGKCGRKS